MAMEHITPVVHAHSTRLASVFVASPCAFAHPAIRLPGEPRLSAFRDAIIPRVAHMGVSILVSRKACSDSPPCVVFKAVEHVVSRAPCAPPCPVGRANFGARQVRWREVPAALAILEHTARCAPCLTGAHVVSV
eukprot:scaffold289055_cov41-Tisochrysis_lutea.AAC.2